MMSVLPILLLLGVLMIASVQGSPDYFEQVYKNHKYLISKHMEGFNLEKMNNRCKQLGGYLVQIDNKMEMSFLVRFWSAARSGGPVFTGITDEGSEGRFYNYNDKTPAKYLKWRWFQPDNWWGENCVELAGYRFNDKGCELTEKYICEIPL
ncbi:Cd209 antigen-like protein c [Plakobranchus ocellatus]|uniref:Cd209 antigen-like protein c n=1 Tax=Plakobranchus ocellatus TaxID=259542 RepID=A0AAV4DIC2_9GAST|nr:Cd209 antigen-like protein c [Plakobranchus ocellatus]